MTTVWDKISLFKEDWVNPDKFVPDAVRISELRILLARKVISPHEYFQIRARWLANRVRAKHVAEPPDLIEEALKVFKQKV